MLEDLPSKRTQRRVFRFASMPEMDDFLAELGLDEPSTEELHDLLSASGCMTSAEDLCDAPFRPKRRLRNPTRFSDGSFPVFYSSLERSTAEAEIRYWFRTYCGNPKRPRTAYYRCFSCSFDGVEKDLRPKIDLWPDLVHDTDYTLCNQLGAEAKTLNLDGLATWSARHDEGTNVPVFERQAIGDPKVEGLVALTYHPERGEVAAVDAPG